MKDRTGRLTERDGIVVSEPTHEAPDEITPKHVRQMAEQVAINSQLVDRVERAVNRLLVQRGPDLAGAGHCRRCGWDLNLHPTDMDGVDVARCPVESESQQIHEMLERHGRELMALATTFPTMRPDR